MRGTFKIFRTVLGTLHPCIDIPEAALPSGPAAGYPAAGEVSGAGESGSSSGEEEEEAEGEGGAERAAAGERRRGLLAHVVAGGGGGPAAAAAAQGGPMGLLSLMTQTLVYKDQVGFGLVEP